MNFTDNDIVLTLFLIGDWSWLAMMVPMVLWYFFAMRWVDKHDEWEK